MKEECDKLNNEITSQKEKVSEKRKEFNRVNELYHAEQKRFTVYREEVHEKEEWWRAEKAELQISALKKVQEVKDEYNAKLVHKTTTEPV